MTREPMPDPRPEGQPGRGSRRRTVAAVAAAATVLCLLALAAIVAREQMAGSLIAAEEARDANDPQGERAALEALVSQDPHDAAALQELARLARTEGRWLDAAGYWAQVARLDPLHGTARFEQARNLMAAGDVPAVLELLGRAEAGLSGGEHAVLARALAMTGDADGARLHGQAALAAAPQDPAVRLLAADNVFMDREGDRDGAKAEAAYRALLGEPDTAAAARLGLAQVVLRRGESERGLELLAEIGSGEPFQVLRARAELYRQMGRLDLAEADWRVLIGRYGQVPDAVVPLAELRAAAGDATGVRDLRDSLRGGDTPSLAARHYLQALEEHLAGNLESARDYLGWSAALYGGRDLYRWLRLDLGARLGDPDLSAPAVESLVRGTTPPARRLAAASLLAEQAASRVDAGEPEVGNRLARQALDLVPDLAAARIVLARAALLTGDAPRARELAQSLTDDSRWRGAALEILGRAALSLKDTGEAQARFAELAAAEPESATAPFWQGIAAFESGDPKASAGLLREAYRRRPDPRVESALIDVLVSQGAWDEALALAKGVAAAPEAADRARGHAYLGGIYRGQGRSAEAASAYLEAAAADPARSPYALTAADLLIGLKRYGQAAEVLDRAAARHPDNPYIAFKLALLAQLDGRAADAETRYRALLTEMPNWALPMINLSELLSSSESTRPEAVSLAERAAALSPGWVEARWNLAQRKADAGADVEALEAARSVLALAPDHGGAATLVARLGGDR